jgi:hypothetical protein
MHAGIGLAEALLTSTGAGPRAVHYPSGGFSDKLSRSDTVEYSEAFAASISQEKRGAFVMGNPVRGSLKILL